MPERGENRGFIIVVSGPSAVGKGTVISRALEKYSRDNDPEREGLWFSVSHTSRVRRTGEHEGVHYFYVSKDEFLRRLASNDILEHNVYGGNYYGTSRAAVEEKLAAGVSAILDIDVNGARQIKELYPDAITVFIMPPSVEELKRRIRLRAREHEDEMLVRLKKGEEEIARSGWYDHILVNLDIDETADKLLDIIESEKKKREAKKGF